MQFVWKYIDDMVGKGLDFSVIAELLLYASATFVPMALPIAVLFASIMTMGNFGERYELIAMKAGGIPVSRIMRPLVVVAVLLTGIAFYFANNVMPTAMLKYKSTLYDITRKKPAVNIRPSQYYNEIEGYVIRINQKDPDDGTLHDIIIYDHSNGLNQTNVIVADNGYMYTTPDDQYMVLSLFDGYTYTEQMDGQYRFSRPFTRIGFKQQDITFDISDFAFDKTSEDVYHGNYQMMNVVQLDTTVSILQERLGETCEEYESNMVDKMPVYRLYERAADTAVAQPNALSIRSCIDTLDEAKRKQVYQQAFFIASSSRDYARVCFSAIASENEYINRHYIEWHRKYTLSLACLLLFLIGAPFGSIVRKGGLGLPLVASVAFFVLYYVIGMISEKMVREGAVGPIGMWYSTLVFLPIGLFLTLQATTDSALFDTTKFRKLFDRLQCFFSSLLHRLKKN